MIKDARLAETLRVSLITRYIEEVVMSAQLLVGSPSVPAPVKTASSLWFTAVGAGVFESALAVAGMLADGSASLTGLAGGLGFRLTVFAAAIFMAVRLRALMFSPTANAYFRSVRRTARPAPPPGAPLRKNLEKDPRKDGTGRRRGSV
ncbi:hypothetical protein AB0O28_35545 [Microbispora sp. NPDC088329]|uniref:hypothetical protein n=1 Tax=Microbispora sp. NPDC088329 TaxID=3154869 RepID=UPI003416987E